MVRKLCLETANNMRKLYIKKILEALISYAIPYDNGIRYFELHSLYDFKLVVMSTCILLDVLSISVLVNLVTQSVCPCAQKCTDKRPPDHVDWRQYQLEIVQTVQYLGIVATNYKNHHPLHISWDNTQYD